MDMQLQEVFEELTIVCANAFPKWFWKFIEVVTLIFAVLHLFTFAYMHASFVQVPVKCLEKETETWSREDILRVEISLKESQAGSVVDCSEGARIEILPSIQNTESHTVAVVKKPPTVTIQIHKEDPAFEENDVILDVEKSPAFINRTLRFKDSAHDADWLSPLKTVLFYMEKFNNTVWRRKEDIIEYSVVYGFLDLSPGARKNASVKVHTVILDPMNDKCFGNHFTKFLLKYIVGYDDVLMRSLGYLIDKDETKGIVSNVRTGHKYHIVENVATTWTTYITAAFIMMAYILPISMLSRYLLRQIFTFFVELDEAFESNIGEMFIVVPILALKLISVGVEVIMSKCLYDTDTATIIIFILCAANLYDSIFCHTPITKRHWPRFFYLYHYVFFAYHYRFNVFNGLALQTSWLLIQHSMLFFFNRYEIPALPQLNEL